METIKITPRGYCHGVVNAINTIKKLDISKVKKPVTVLGMVIHNKKIVEALDQKGVKTLSNRTKSRSTLLDDINEGTVIFTAHGVSPKVRQKAIDKGLDIIDTTCDDVLKTQEIIIDKINQGYDIIYIGKKRHPESEAAKEISDRVHLIENEYDLDNLAIYSDKMAITNQTTMSLYDVFAISEYAKEVYPHIEIIDEICNATRIRQEAVAAQDQDIDFCFVIGDKLSNNTRKLVEVSIEKAGVRAGLIESVEDIDVENLKHYKKVSITSGASTPTQITNEVYNFLVQFEPQDLSTYDNKSKVTMNDIIK